LALQEIYQKGKPRDILSERRNPTPSRKDFEGFFPGVRDFSIYLLQLFLLVSATVAYSLLDIFFYNYIFEGDHNNDGQPDMEDGLALYCLFLLISFQLQTRSFSFKPFNFKKKKNSHYHQPPGSLFRFSVEIFHLR